MPSTAYLLTTNALFGALLGCAADAVDEDAAEQASTTITSTIASVNDRDLGPCPSVWGGTCHYYELYPGAGGFANPDPLRYVYRAIAFCDGEIYSAIPGFSDSTAITYQASGQINVAVRTTKPNPTCTLQLQYSAISGDIDPSPDRTDPDPSYTNAFGPVNKLLASSAVELTSTVTKQRLRVHGAFAGDGTYVGQVTCDDAPVATTLLAKTSTSVDLEIPVRAQSSSCTAKVRRIAPGFDFTSNTVPVRLSGGAPTLAPTFAAYYWAGFQSPTSATGSFAAGTEQLVGDAAQGTNGAGFQSIRIRLAPSVRLGGSDSLGIDARSALAQCPASAANFLGCGIQMTEYQQALAKLPKATPTRPVHVMMTVYDAASVGPYFGDWRVTDAAWMNDPTHQAAVRAEYAELTYQLYRTQAGTGRTFIIANWESDNQIYCGDMNTYAATNGASCPGAAGPNGTFAAFKTWMQLRKQGVAAGFARATAEGLTSASTTPVSNPAIVGDGIEFNSFRILNGHSPRLADTLHDIIGDVKPAYASYSAWESANAGTLDDDLAAIKALLASTTGGATQLVIGEIGDGYNLPFQFAESLRAAYRARLPVVTLWQAFPTSVSGLLRSDGSETLSMREARKSLAAYTPTAVLPPQGVQIAAVVDRGIDGGSPAKRWFEIYGSFPTGASYSATATCMSSNGVGSVTLTGEIGFQSSGQLNVGFANPLFQPTWCTFAVARASVQSPQFGPRRVCRAETPGVNPPTWCP